MHHNNKIDNITGKPEVIMYYNSTKGGIHMVDQKCSVHSSSRRTTHLPMAVFFRVVDMACCNAQVIYESQSDVPKLKRLDFLKSIAENLNESNLMTRLHSTRLPRQILEKRNS
ncbi:unnamed protein product [Euphydryas editha]|uniref:PiggyBac transposable element-derived protein domain-containing protein n=1 Tax=Euphydryas editha TaxID=104508 RepID=A0AAU9TP70_EUPED|nr:unnamed protein product [Euphydryas editha]